MPIASTDIQYRLSGGASNALPALSVGGAKSSTSAPSALFPDKTGAELTAGGVDYRCVYVHNGHATLPVVAAVLWIASNTPSTTTTADVGLGTSALNGTEPSAGSAAPTGVTFTAAANQAAGLALGDIPAGQSRAVWIRRTVSAGTSAANDGLTIRTTGDTAA